MDEDEHLGPYERPGYYDQLQQPPRVDLLRLVMVGAAVGCGIAMVLAVVVLLVEFW
jgi:hypothetical protein